MTTYLVDTSFIVDLIKNQPRALEVHERIGGMESISMISIYEIAKHYSGIYEVLMKKRTIGFQKKEAVEAARVFKQLKKQGKLIPEMDMMIAGTAISNGMVLVTRDEHYKRVAGLKAEFY